MGAVLGTAGCLACCCGSAACSLCSCCPSCKNSTSSRIVYALFLLFSTIVSMIMLSPKVEEKLEDINWFCKKAGTDCKEISGYVAVYRVEFATCMFFILMALLMIGVRSSRDPRSGIQNGFWAIKFLILIGGIVGAFFIPNDEGSFAEVWMYVGLVGSFIFILHQLILLVDFAHSWNETWIDNAEETENKCWYAALMTFTIIMYGGAIAGIVLMYIYFTQASGETCHVEKFVVSFELIMCFVMSGIAILPSVQDKQSRSGLLQAAAISLYTTYLTWSALSYRGNACNEFASAISSGHPKVDAQSIVGVVITFILVVFASVRTSSSSNIGQIGLGDNGDGGSVVDTSDGERQVHDDEEESVTYSYTFYHIIMALATLYLMMTLTNWYKPDKSNLDKLAVSDASFWVKITSSWICMGLYIWTLLAPVCFPDRDFGN